MGLMRWLGRSRGETDGDRVALRGGGFCGEKELGGGRNDKENALAKQTASWDAELVGKSWRWADTKNVLGKGPGKGCRGRSDHFEGLVARGGWD